LRLDLDMGIWKCGFRRREKVRLPPTDSAAEEARLPPTEEVRLPPIEPHLHAEAAAPGR
jgi:hypothetical protein